MIKSIKNQIFCDFVKKFFYMERYRFNTEECIWLAKSSLVKQYTAFAKYHRCWI